MLQEYDVSIATIDRIVAATTLPYTDNTICVCTDVIQFANAYAANTKTTAYLLTPQILHYDDIDFVNALTLLNNIAASKSYVNVFILTKHIDVNDMHTLYAYLLENKLYNVMSMLDVMYDDVKNVGQYAEYFSS
jgi:hypothetical protein